MINVYVRFDELLHILSRCDFLIVFYSLAWLKLTLCGINCLQTFCLDELSNSWFLTQVSFEHFEHLWTILLKRQIDAVYVALSPYKLKFFFRDCEVTEVLDERFFLLGWLQKPFAVVKFRNQSFGFCEILRGVVVSIFVLLRLKNLSCCVRLDDLERDVVVNKPFAHSLQFASSARISAVICRPISQKRLQQSYIPVFFCLNTFKIRCQLILRPCRF